LTGAAFTLNAVVRATARSGLNEADVYELP